MTNLSNSWNVWIYEKQNDWSKTNLKIVKEIKTIKDFVDFDKDLRLNKNNLLNKHIFIMKKKIVPLWEEKENKYGGCWTFKSSAYDSLEHFMHLFLIIITNNFLENEFNPQINGITFAIKKNNNCIIQVWNDNYEHLKNINHHFYVREVFAYNIIYKKHIR